jgi:hypothetical protein
VSFLVAFQTGSIGLYSGEYGGKRLSSMRCRFATSHSFPSGGRLWQGALSMIRKTLRPWYFATSRLRKVQKVLPLKTSANQ